MIVDAQAAAAALNERILDAADRSPGCQAGKAGVLSPASEAESLRVRN